jgi:hypothetical protein
MGKFDDNRYVQNVKAEFEKKDQAVAAVLPPEVVAAISKSKTLTSVESLSTLFIEIKPFYEKLAPAQQGYVRLQFKARKDILQPEATGD